MLNDFHMEIISQTDIIHYIEYQFETDLKAASTFLKINIEKNLYSNNTSFMQKLVSHCEDLLDQISDSYVEESSVPEKFKNVDSREPVGEVLNYCLELLETGNNIDSEELNTIIDEVNDYIEENFYDYDKIKLDEIIDVANIIHNYRKNNELAKKEEIISSLLTSIKLVDNYSLSNIFRQSFINIFSIFDAYVFEGLTKFFNDNPKELSVFLELKNNDLKITFEDILVFDSIDELKNNVIQNQFNGKYLSEMIRKLNKYKPKLFEGINYVELMEMIERRNIHLHNKGFVDYKYYILKEGTAGFLKTNTFIASIIAGVPPEKAAYILDVMDWRNYVDLNKLNSGIEGFDTIETEINVLLFTGDIGFTKLDKLVMLIQTFRLNTLLCNHNATQQDIEGFFRFIGQSGFSDLARASLGSRFLNFKSDSKNIIHSQPRQWQAIGGYNNGYDALFRTFTGGNMDREKFEFTIGNMQYIFWVWRGDYLNLGAGAEVGIYSRPNWLTQGPDSLDHYFTDYDLALPNKIVWIYWYDEELLS